jgi:hypothetical protein
MNIVAKVVTELKRLDTSNDEEERKERERTKKKSELVCFSNIVLCIRMALQATTIDLIFFFMSCFISN